MATQRDGQLSPPVVFCESLPPWGTPSATTFHNVSRLRLPDCACPAVSPTIHDRPLETPHYSEVHRPGYAPPCRTRPLASSCLEELPRPIIWLQKVRSLLFEAFSLGLDISLIWIPAHVGIIGNETADRLAKIAIRYGDLLKSSLPSSDIVTIASAKARNRTKRYLTSLFSKKGIKYFEKNLFNPNKPWFYKMYLERSIITSMSRLRSGHCNSKALLFRFDSPMCQCGRSIENISHIFVNCPRFEEARGTLLNKLRDLDIPHPLEDIYPLLCKPSHATATAIAHFLHKFDLLL